MMEVPVRAFHAAKNDAVPVSGSRDRVEALGKLSAGPRYTEFPGGIAMAPQGRSAWLVLVTSVYGLMLAAAASPLRADEAVRAVKVFEVYPGTADTLPDGRVLVTWNYIADDKAKDGYYERREIRGHQDPPACALCSRA